MSSQMVIARNQGTVAPISPPSYMDASGNVPVLQILLEKAGHYLVFGQGLIQNVLPNPSPGQAAIYLLPGGNNSPLYIDFSSVRLGGFGDFSTDGGVQQCISLLGKHTAKAGDVIYLGFYTVNGNCQEYSLAAIMAGGLDY